MVSFKSSLFLFPPIDTSTRPSILIFEEKSEDREKSQDRSYHQDCSKKIAKVLSWQGFQGFSER